MPRLRVAAAADSSLRVCAFASYGFLRGFGGSADTATAAARSRLVWTGDRAADRTADRTVDRTGDWSIVSLVPVRSAVLYTVRLPPPFLLFLPPLSPLERPTQLALRNTSVSYSAKLAR